MTRASMFVSFALAAALAVLFPTASLAQPARPNVEELKRGVEQREQELRDAQIALAVARGRLALAEGKAELAAAEWRKVLRHHEGHLKVVQDLLARGRLCSVEPLKEAQGSVAVARAWLAEAEGRRDDLRAELPKVIAYHEWRMERHQCLRRPGVISEEVADEAIKVSETELGEARERLARLPGDPTKEEQTGKKEKP
jgi:hypothetical protein